MFGWFSKRSNAAATTSAATAERPSNELSGPVMREVPSPPAASAAPVARPEFPPGSRRPTHDVFVAQLRNEDVSIRVAAARELGRRGDPLAVSALMPALRDAHSAVRIAAAHALGKLRDERAIERLAGAMSDDDGAVHSAARGALLAIGTAAADEAITEHDARPKQTERDGSEEDESGDRANHNVVEDNVLAEQADHDATANMASLEQTDRDATEDDAHGPPQPNGSERYTPTPAGAGSLADLIEHLRGDDEQLRAQAADRLADVGSPAVDPLIALLGEEKVWVRKRAAALLGRIGDGRAAEPLRAALAGISREDRSFETYQFRDAVERAIAAVDGFVNAPPPPPEAPGTIDERAPSIVSSSARVDSTLSDLTDAQLGERLLDIARAALGGGKPPLDSYDARRSIARSIGDELHRRGGITTMRNALDAHVGSLPGRHPIEQAWDGVGEWMG